MTRERKKGKGKFIIVFVVLVCLASLAYFALNQYYNNSIFMPVSDAGEPKKIEIVINKGSTTAEISDILLTNGLIKDKTVFMVYLKRNNLDNKMQAGKYEFNTGMNAVQIANKLAKGDVKKDTVRVTIPEGYELKEIAAAYEKAGLVKKEKFMEAAQNTKFDYEFLKALPNRTMKLEGYLFPDTYEFAKDVTAEQIIIKMLDRFNSVFNDEMKRKASQMNLTIDQVITMASIVEREAKVANERPIVSAVFYNRIKSSMRLESCATIQYALGERKEKLLYVDLEIKSPYNTYRNDGLPVGPIANPGEASIRAALNPANVNYLFFVAKSDGSGTHAFTVTYDDFLREKQANK